MTGPGIKRQDFKNVVYTYVVADILHFGHLEYLRKAKELGDCLIVGVLTNKAVEEKKPTPIMTFEERIEIVKNIKYVDFAIAQSTYSPSNNVRKIRPNILVESDSHDEMPANNFVENYGGKVVILPYYKGQSSTSIKKKINERF